jgi:transposase
MPRKHLVRLGEPQRQQLRALIRTGRAAAQTLTHARILLKADAGQTDSQIAAAVEVSTRTVWRVRRRWAEQGLDAALHRRPQPARPQKRCLDGAGEAHLIALACSPPPEGRESWTLQLLADRLVELKCADRLSDETVRRVLKKTN